MENLQANLTLIQQRLAAASDGKYPVPKLIAVTKTHPAEDILPLQNLGVTDIGENKVQEIMETCFPRCYKNPYIKVGYFHQLPAVQRIGPWIFVCALRVHGLKLLTKLVG